MVLGFKEQFKEPINLCTKIHTIRRDEHNRWKQGNSIQFATGVRTKNYNEFATGICVSTQTIEFKWHNHHKGMGNEGWSVKVFIDGRDITTEDDIVDQLIANNGFTDRVAFFTWEAWNKKDFKGKIIHWTDKKY